MTNAAEIAAIEAQRQALRRRLERLRRNAPQRAALQVRLAQLTEQELRLARRPEAAPAADGRELAWWQK